jgi:hypothetical protein
MIDKSNARIIGHILIRDPDTNEVLVKKRDSYIPVQTETFAPEDKGADDDTV